MYNIKIIITNQNSVKNTTAETFSVTRNFAILSYLQYFLQSLKIFVILFAILSYFAIFFAILETFATSIEIL